VENCYVVRRIADKKQPVQGVMCYERAFEGVSHGRLVCLHWLLGHDVHPLPSLPVLFPL